MKIKCLQVGPIGTNCYLLCDEDAKTCAVIDPGGDGARIAAAVAETGCVPCAILLTHGHYDHTGAVGELQAKWRWEKAWGGKASARARRSGLKPPL